MTFREIIDQEYRECGFSAIGAVSFSGPVEEDRKRFEAWLERGFAGNMGYLERSREYRHDLRRLFPEVRSVIVTLTSYNRGDLIQREGIPKIARYVWSENYHDVVKENLHRLLKRIQSYEGFEKVTGRGVADSAPAFEKVWALKAGLGWIGRNSLLVHRELGSYVIIGLLLTDREWDEPTEAIAMPDGCGECRRCEETCPTGAILPGERVLDARKCLSYWTTTGNPTPPDPEYKRSLEGRIWGCDSCQEACPYNKTGSAVRAGAESPLVVRPEWIGVSREEWLDMTDEEFAERFRGSSLTETTLEKLKALL